MKKTLLTLSVSVGLLFAQENNNELNDNFSNKLTKELTNFAINIGEKRIQINEEKITLFENGKNLFCSTNAYRFKINKNDWVFLNNRFENKKNQFFYVDECKK